MNIEQIIANYDLNNLTIGVLGGHSALDVCRGAKKLGFKTLAVCQKDRAATYEKFYKTKENKFNSYGFGFDKGETQGCVDEIIAVDKFGDVTDESVQELLRAKNTIFVHNRYFWVYCDFEKVENDFRVPIFGNRSLVKLEERDHPNNQYVLLQKAGIRIPQILRAGGANLSEEKTQDLIADYFQKKGGALIVKVNEAQRKYERAFFVISSVEAYKNSVENLISQKTINSGDLGNAVIEEFILGAPINFNFFYSPLTKSLELMGTDTRRQTNLDGFLRLDAATQMSLISQGVKPSMIETGHIACTVKESLLEKAFAAGEKFVATLNSESETAMIGPFALQGAISAEQGREELVVFDVSMRIPGSPGTNSTPYSAYLYGESMSYGERIALEIKAALGEMKLPEILT
jgi:5-formaminoimidazole-4-carboxamide-1-(beta)-D-ribofuranosyl 5'-monophosphate synthetase